MMYAKVQTRLALCDKMYPAISFVVVRYKPRSYCSLTHLPLLLALPAIRMTQDEFYPVFNGLPERCASLMAFEYELLAAFKQISEEIRKDRHDVFTWRKWGNGVLDYCVWFGFHNWTEVELEPSKCELKKEAKAVNKRTLNT